jgi:hypothetical protein
MDNLNDLKKIWLTADTKGLPNSGEMVRRVKKYRNQMLLGKTIVVIAALALTVFWVWIMFWFKSKMVTTRIGEVLMLISTLILLVTNLNSWNRFYKFNDFDNVDFIKFLEKTKRRQMFYFKKTQVVAMAFCAIGLIIYMVEPALKSFAIGLSLLAFVIVYLLIIWFIVRPRAYKRQEKKMDETIKKYELLTKQLNDQASEENL